MRKLRLLLVSLAVVAATVGFLPAAHAYSLEGPRWPGQPAPGTCCAHILYRNSAAYSDDYSGWSAGAAGWNNSSALLYYDLSSNDDVLAEDTNDNSVTWDGHVHYQYYYGSNGKKYFISGDVTAILNHYFTRNYGAGQIKSVAGHELGHALGLGHHAGCYLMEHNTATRWGSCGINTPQPDDVHGANALY